jgi:hypothetical protein
MIKDEMKPRLQRISISRTSMGSRKQKMRGEEKMGGGGEGAEQKWVQLRRVEKRNTNAEVIVALMPFLRGVLKGGGAALTL